MSTGTNKSAIATGIILTIGGLLVGVSMLVGGSKEVTFPDSFEFVPSDFAPGAAVVVSKVEREGLVVFGVVFRSAHYQVNVEFAAPHMCFDELSPQVDWPPPNDDCSGPIHAVGQIGGLGITIEGDTFVNVALQVTEECYLDLQPGTEWTSLPAACHDLAATSVE